MNRVYRLFRYDPSQARIGQNCLFGHRIFRQILWRNLFDWHVLLEELDNHDLKLKQLYFDYIQSCPVSKETFDLTVTEGS